MRAVRTVVISDLHLGAPRGRDLLRRADLREPLLELLRSSQRLVILGDGLELRHAPHRDAAEVARPFLEDVGRALGAEGEVLMLAGNHDHGLVAGWIDGRLSSEPAGFLGLEQRIAPHAAGPLAVRVAERLAPARVELSYPGAWLRDDVYATHGHYSDVHTTMPTFERLAVGAMARWAIDMPADGACPDDYEAALAPIYAWMHQLTQRSEHSTASAAAGASTRTWTMLVGAERRRRPLRALALKAAYVTAVSTLDALGIGPLDRDVSAPALRRGGLYGMGEVARRLRIGAPYLLFGHTHRSGPWPDDDPGEWVAPTGSRMVNTGSWVYQPHFLPPAPNTSPYWPGTAVVLDDHGPPRITRLLGQRGREELAPPPG